MASLRNGIASGYLDALEKASPARSPLRAATKFNSKTALAKHDSPDLDDMARQMNIDTPTALRTGLLPSRFDSPSAIVLSFKSTPSSLSGSHVASSFSVEKGTDSSRAKVSNESKGYEYLCRVEAIKNWLQAVLGEPIVLSAAQLISYIQNGIHLAKLANVFLPVKKPVYTNDSRLEFRHTENINRFFKLLQFLEIPDLFHFELTDLYDAKDVPKVFFCLHAMSYKISALNASYPVMENLVGLAQFDPADIKIANRALSGHHLPNFASADTADVSSPGTNSYMNKALAVPSPAKSPVKTPARPLANFSTRATGLENPFLEKPKRADLSLPPAEFRLNTVDMPDLTVNSPSRIARSPSTYHYSRPDTQSSFYTPELENHMRNIVKLQALAKGSIVRYEMFVKRIMLRSYETEFTEFFSIIRGVGSRRKTVHRHRDQLLWYSDYIVRLQSIARCKLYHKFSNSRLNHAQELATVNLQSLARGQLIRRPIEQKREELEGCLTQIIGVQSRLRAKPIHYRVSTLVDHRDEIESHMIRFQSAIRRCLYNRQLSKHLVCQLAGKGEITELQAIIRGGHSRNRVREKLRGIAYEARSLFELQNIARGAILRTRLCNNVLITLLGEDLQMNRLFGKVRANFVRQDIQEKRSKLLGVEHTQIIPLQSAFRGVLQRFMILVDLEDIYESVDHVINFQAKIRANKVRREHASMDSYYKAREPQIIRAQAILRSKYVQTAYRALISMKNPPVEVVRKFAYLLSDSGFDFQEELDLSELKDQILEKSRTNEDLELQIENLDIKLSLLDKNKITIEDFMLQGNKFKTYKPTAHTASRAKSLEKLNKSARKRVDLYLSMFYFLQTKPSYWLRMYERLSPFERGSLPKKLQSQILLIFQVDKSSVGSQTREEYFFLKLICALMENDTKHYSRNIADITKIKATFWISFISELNNTVNHRSHLKSFLGRTVERIVDDDELNFESDPSKIYLQLRTKEMNVHGTSEKAEDISPQAAIKDEQVSAMFVKNLMSLRDVAIEIIGVLSSSIHLIPIHMRIIAKEAYRLAQIYYPEQTEQLHLSVAGVILIKHYILNIFQLPMNYGYCKKDPLRESTARSTPEENLSFLAKVLLQVFSMKPFNDNFMKPLNDFVLSYTETTKQIVRSAINVKQLDIEYEMNDYDDLVTTERPHLTMKVSDMIAVEKLMSEYADIAIPTLDDQLFPIVCELNEVINSADDYVTLTELGSITLTLSPRSKEDSVADAKTKSLFAQAKRCVLYVIQVQDGDDLLELFIRGITQEHEQTFQEIITKETKESGQKTNSIAPYKRSSLGDLTNMKYVELKKQALKVIIQLESLGLVSRRNSYQEILNQIVVDIKTKDSQRSSRKTQLLIATNTVNKLLEKESFLKRQLADYNKHIDLILSDLQLRPKEKKLFNIIPVFSKQYFYHRQLKKNNRLPKFGSYKYSAKKLMDQKVIYDMGGALFRKASSSSRIEFMFSCHKTGQFVIEAANGTVTIPGACVTIKLDDLLEHQYENKKHWVMFDGMVTFETEAFAALIFRNFYDIRKD